MVFVLYTSTDNVLYFYEVSLKWLKWLSSYRANMKLPWSNFKGDYSKKVKARITVLVLCTSSDDALNFYEI